VRRVIELHLNDNAQEAGFMRKRCLLLLIILITVCLLIYIAGKVQNVFDEMYYALSETSIIPLTLAKYSDLSNVNSINREVIDENGWFFIVYNDSFAESAYIYLHGKTNEKKIAIQVQLAFDGYRESKATSGYCIWLIYEYSIVSKELVALPMEIMDPEYQSPRNVFIMEREDARSFMTEHSIDIEKIEEWNQYYLCDKVLADWFRYNGWRSRFSINNLGNVKIVWDQW
jgi:hypothetical protein